MGMRRKGTKAKKKLRHAGALNEDRGMVGKKEEDRKEENLMSRISMNFGATIKPSNSLASTILLMKYQHTVCVGVANHSTLVPSLN